MTSSTRRSPTLTSSWCEGLTARLSLALAQFQNHRLRVRFVAANWRLFAVEAGDIVTLTNARHGFSAKKFRVMKVSRGSNKRLQFDLTEHVPEVYGKRPQGMTPSKKIVQPTTTSHQATGSVAFEGITLKRVGQKAGP